MSLANIDPQELTKFTNMASTWWDPDGVCRFLHSINPLRLQFISQHAALTGKSVLDIGCGGGLLTEGLARQGAIATGIDGSSELIAVADQHARQQALNIDYATDTAEAFAEKYSGQFSVVTCLELLEHVPDPGTLIQACSQLTQPGGHVFFSTINRHPRAYLFTILFAEYALNWLPKGTHRYEKFIRPSELAASARAAGLGVQHLQGLTYHALTQRCSLSADVRVNYLAHCHKR